VAADLEVDRDVGRRKLDLDRVLSAFAQTKDGKMDASKTAALEAACKGKKAGDVVKVDGKDTKCPEAKAAKK